MMKWIYPGNVDKNVDLAMSRDDCLDRLDNRMLLMRRTRSRSKYHIQQVASVVDDIDFKAYTSRDLFSVWGMYDNRR